MPTLYTDEGRHFGTSGNLSMFEYEWWTDIHFHTEGLPNARCFDQTNTDAFRVKESEAHAAGSAQLGEIFARNANLV